MTKRNEYEFRGAGTTGEIPDPGSERGWFLRDDGVWAPASEGGLERGIQISDIRSPNETVYGDYLVGGLQVGRGVNAPDLETLADDIVLPAFAGTGVLVEQGYFTVHILHDFKAGTYPTFHVHWTHNNASPSGNVKWNISYVYAHGYGVQQYASTSTKLSTTQAAGAQYTHHITPDDDMTITADMEPDGQILARIWRDPADAADTFADDAFLIGIDCHYVLGQLATTERNRPFTSAGF